MNKLITILAVALVVSLTVPCFADGPEWALRGTLKTNGNEHHFAYVFDAANGVITEFSFAAGRETSTSLGEYSFDNERLKIVWKTGAIETGRLVRVRDNVYQYTIQSHSSDKSQIGSMTTLNGERLPITLAEQLAVNGQLYRMILDQQKANSVRQGQQIRNLQHQINMLPYKYTEAFGKALGQ